MERVSETRFHPGRVSYDFRELTQAEIEVFFNPSTNNFNPEKLALVKDVHMNILNFPYESEAREFGFEESISLLGGRPIIAYYFALLQNFYESVGFEKRNTRFPESWRLLIS